MCPNILLIVDFFSCRIGQELSKHTGSLSVSDSTLLCHGEKKNSDKALKNIKGDGNNLNMRAIFWLSKPMVFYQTHAICIMIARFNLLHDFVKQVYSANTLHE